MSIPELECAWCGVRQANRAELIWHEAGHRREDDPAALPPAPYVSRARIAALISPKRKVA